MAAPDYVLEGLSEERQEQKRLEQIAVRKIKIKRKLQKVNRKLIEAEEKRQVRMLNEMHYARDELQRVKLALSKNPYQNMKPNGTKNKFKSRISDIAFKYPDEPARSTNQNVFTGRLLEQGKHIDKPSTDNNRQLGEFTNYLQKVIRAQRMGS